MERLQSYSEATQWWEFTSSPVLQDAALPDDLLDEAAIAIPITDTGDTGDTASEEAAP